MKCATQGTMIVALKLVNKNDDANGVEVRNLIICNSLNPLG